MSSYTVEGYLAAIRMRAGRNVLVEGSTDAKIVARVVAELEHRGDIAPGVVILDPVELIQDSDLPPGHRDAVEYVYYRAEEEGLPLAALVDREFREFSIEGALTDSLSRHYQSGALFWTRGHSIENYFFSDSYLISFLKMKYPESIEHIWYSRIRDAIPAILAISAAASLAISSCGITARCRDACGHDNWMYSPDDGSTLDLNAYQAALGARGISEEDRTKFLDAFLDFSERVRMSPDEATARWVSHGHLGWNFLWSGIAGVLRECGAPGTIVDAVARGFNEEKLRYTADQWASEAVEGGAESPTGLWRWLASAA